MTHTIIEYEFSQHRSTQYAKAACGRDIEVLFAGSEAPEDSRYTWEHVPRLSLSLGPLSMRSSLALRTALEFSRSKIWIVVKPGVGQLYEMCRLARKKSVTLSVWLDDSQRQVWFGVTLLRAAGFQIQTQHLGVGLSKFVADGVNKGDEFSKGEAA